jgi:hypothetical protein
MYLPQMKRIARLAAPLCAGGLLEEAKFTATMIYVGRLGRFVEGAYFAATAHTHKTVHLPFAP